MQLPTPASQVPKNSGAPWDPHRLVVIVVVAVAVVVVAVVVAVVEEEEVVAVVAVVVVVVVLVVAVVVEVVVLVLVLALEVEAVAVVVVVVVVAVVAVVVVVAAAAAAVVVLVVVVVRSVVVAFYDFLLMSTNVAPGEHASTTNTCPAASCCGEYCQVFKDVPENPKLRILCHRPDALGRQVGVRAFNSGVEAFSGFEITGAVAGRMWLRKNVICCVEPQGYCFRLIRSFMRFAAAVVWLPLVFRNQSRGRQTVRLISEGCLSQALTAAAGSMSYSWSA